ncbi:MAG: PAS domain-containing protein, partial [Actinomycetota bacterium]
MSGDQLRRQLNGTLDHLHLALEAGRLGTWEYYFADESFAHDRLCAQLFGADPDGPPLSIEDCLAAVHEDDQPVLRRQVTAALASGSSYEEVFRVRHPDGSLRWTLERARASFDDQGWPERLDGVVMDVTDREDAALRVIETLDSVRDGYLELDNQWRFTHVNRSAEETIGRPRDELYGQRVFDVLPELVGTEFEQHHRNVADSGEPTVFEALYEPWQRWYEVRVSPTEHGVVVFFVDITDRVNHRFEQQRRLEAERAARQAAEAARARLTHIAAHDELTGLLSRREFERRLDERLRTVTNDLVVLFLDLDDFKIVNDGLGHAIGDRVLSDIAGRLREHVADEM